jgi:transcription initiation factor TFIIB
MSACPNCGSAKLVFDPHSGELKCAECGFVLEEGFIDTGPEWRAYDEEQRLARSRAEPARPLAKLSTVIGRGGVQGAARRAEFARLSLIHAAISGEEERSLKAGREEISRLTSALQLPQRVREEAFRLFTLAQRAGLLKGSSVTCMAVACIALACREFGIPNPAPKLCEVAPAEPSRVRRSYALLLQHLGGKLKLEPPSPLKYLPMIASKLGLSAGVQRTAAEIIRAADEARILLGKPPKSIAAAALYISSAIHGEKRGRAAFAEAAGITETTLRKRVRELMRRLDVHVHI